MLTMTSMLERTILMCPDRTAVVGKDLEVTWSEWGERISRAAGLLASAGVKKGDRFAILALNSARQAEAMHAGYWMGATPVPVNFRLAPPEIRHVIDDAGCELLVLDPELASILDLDLVAEMVEAQLSLEAGAWDSAIAGAEPLPKRDAAEEDEALLLYTGGTSGRGKGVPLTHRNIVSDAMQLNLAWPGGSSACVLHVAPMFHAADLCNTPFTLHGHKHVFLPRFTPESMFRAIEEHQVTAILLVPTMILMAAEAGVEHDYDLSSWRHCIYGTAPMNPDLIQKFMRVFPEVGLAQGYGLTETSPILTVLDESAHREAIATGHHTPLMSCGRPIPGVDIRIVDDAGTEAPHGEAGELTARGPNVFEGYLNLPEETEAALRDGWFHTRDVGCLGEDGFYYLLDRKQNLIITGGENVYSNEVESILYEHPAVKEAAVIGLADEQYGEVVTAVIVADDSTQLSGEELRTFCRDKIGGYKIPRRYEFRTELPKSAVGKILKRELREIYAAE